MESNQPAMKAFNDVARLALIQDLERLRELVLERLSSIEMLARDHVASALPTRETAAMDDLLEKKSAELEETRRWLQVQAERERQDWIAAMSQLEDDRHLLAEAWERVEAERIESLTGPQTNPSHEFHAENPRVAPNGLPARSAAIPIRSAGAGSDSYNPVAHDILRQFQTLRSDVRQSAVGRRASR
jgi:hypothetical protein